MASPPASLLTWVVMPLAFYGGLLLLYRLIRLVRALRFKSWGPPPVSVLLLVRDQEHQIEGLIRGLVGLIRGHLSLARCDLVVVDHDSSDQTAAIAERLSRQIAGLRVIRAGGRPTVQTPCEVGLFSCQSRVVLVLDLVGALETRPLLDTVAVLLSGTAAQH